MNIIESIKLVYVDVNGNNNKLWQAELLDNDDVHVQWGRVGAKLQSTTHTGAGRRKFDALKREKLSKGYEVARTVDRTPAAPPSLSLQQIAVQEICGTDGSEDVKTLIQYLSETNIHNILEATTLTYTGGGTFATPLGVLTSEALTQAKRHLAELAVLAGSNRTAVLNAYLRLVPQKLPAKIDPLTLFATPDALQQQQDLLEALEAVMPTVVASTRLFDCRVLRVPHTSEEGRATFRRIRSLYEATLNPAHPSASLKLRRIWQVRIAAMAEAFEAQLGNVQPLWHGTRASNLLSILKRGLVIPPASAAHCTGRMFGNGAYFSKQSTKSLNYATGFWNASGPTAQRTFMFLTDVALGKAYRPRTRIDALPPGYDSVWVEPGTCGVLNHEAIVYRTSQANFRFLCEFA